MKNFGFTLLSLLAINGLDHLSVSANEPSSLVNRLSEYTEKSGPGLALMVIQNGKVLKKEGFGFADLEKKTPIDDHTNFNLASNSKAFTAMAILILEHEGKLSPDDFVARYIDDFPPYAKNVKIKHLLHHTSGLPDYGELCKSAQPVTNQDVLSFLRSKDALVFAEGAKFEYSDTGYVVLSEIIERVSGESFPEFISKSIFKKLGMTDTYIVSPQEGMKIPRLAKAYSNWPLFDRNDSNPCDHVYGDGGIVTNLNDYAHWIAGLTQPILLPEDFLKRVFLPGQANDGGPINYGYGWFIDQFMGHKMITHAGGWLAHRALTAFFPEKNLWIVVLSNYEAIPQLDIVKEIAAKYL